MAAMLGTPNLFGYLIYRLHTHEFVYLVALEPQPYLEEQYKRLDSSGPGISCYVLCFWSPLSRNLQGNCYRLHAFADNQTVYSLDEYIVGPCAKTGTQY
jgi:hypothetical protein